ncbi:MAG: putative metal-dependent hydrolase [Gemmatimonadota bacterium]|nr:putative metal-dependent hydrolase [Gemmatimonadota bacterium]
MTKDPRYPIGPFSPPVALSPEERDAAVSAIEVAPQRLREAVSGLNDAQLDTRYRPGGWTVRQLVHHVADSHINAFVRLKLTLTEDGPTIRTYDQARWAELADASAPVDVSLDLLDRVHERWVMVWRSMTPEDWARQLEHPEVGRMGVDQLLALYAWHGRHHVAHVTTLREAEGW